jgi:hypothetical protein
LAPPSYPIFRRPPISSQRKESILGLTKGNKGKEEYAMMSRIHTKSQNRVYTDPRINLMGERVDRVWADPILNPRKEIDRWPPGLNNYQGGVVMKEKARNVKTDKKFWTDPMSFPVYTPKRGR